MHAALTKHTARWYPRSGRELNTWPHVVATGNTYGCEEQGMSLGQLAVETREDGSSVASVCCRLVGVFLPPG